MADRSVKVTLVLAAQGYMSGMDAVAQKTAKTGTEIEKLSQKREAFQALGTGALAFGTATAAGVGVAISRFAEFDQQMSSVQAATHETSGGMEVLRNAALDAGESTVYSATEAAAAIEELSKAGVSTADILSGGLAGSLDLAAAGQLGVARSAEITSTALNQFGLSGDRASHVADVLAAGAGKAMGSVEDLAQGLKYVGPVAASMGVSLEETTGVLALFAQKGIIGEQAGTSFRGMLSSLTSPSAAAKSEIDRLGITLYDSQGKFLGMQNAAGELAKAYGTMDGASRDASLGVIFGRGTVTAATALYEAGAGGVAKWTAAVDDSGYAAKTARERLDNLRGDVEALGGAFDTALIQTGSGANDVLREMVQGVTFLIGAYNDLPEPVQTSVLLIGAAAAAVALSGGAALVAVPKWAELRSTITATGLSMGRIALQGAGVGLALSVLGAVIGTVVGQQADMASGAQEFADTLDDATGAVTGYTRELIAKKLAEKGAFDGAKEAGISQRELTDALYQGGDAYEAIMRRLRDAHDASGGWNATIGNSINAVKDMNVQLGDAGKRHDDLKASQAETVDSSKTAAESYLAAADGAEQLNSTLDQLIETINAANGVGQDAVTTNAQYQEALAGITTSVDDQRAAYEQANGTLDGFNLSLDQNTLSGAQNAASLAGVASAAQQAATAQFEQDKTTMSAKDSTDKYNATLGAQRQAFIDSAIQAGYNADEVQALADQVFRMPSEKQVDIIAETAAAEERLRQFQDKPRLIRVPVSVYGQDTYTIAGTGIQFNATGNYYSGGKVKEFAAGGWASGIYPATKGGIHRFAEAGHDEAYITMDPQHIVHSRQVWSEVGDKLGLWEAQPLNARAWSPAPATATATAAAATDRPLVEVHNSGPSYSYDPTDIARAQTEQITRALDAYGIR